MEENKKLKEKIEKEASSSSNDEMVSSPIKNNYFNRRSRGRGKNAFGLTKSPFGIFKTENYPYQEKKIKLENKDEFPNLVPRSDTYSSILKTSTKKDFSYIVKQYMNNFLKIVNKFKQVPCELISKTGNKEDSTGYITYPYEKYNVVIALPGCKSNIIKAAYDYGLLHTVYTKDGSELTGIPELFRVVKNYLAITRAQLVYIRCYTAIGEVTYEEIYQPIRIIKIGVTNSMIIENVEGIIAKEIELIELPELLTRKRAWGLKQLIVTIKELVKNPIWVNHTSQNTVITTIGSTYGNDALFIMEKIYLSLVKNEDEDNHSKIIPKKLASVDAMKNLCKLLMEEENHECQYCGTHGEKIPYLDEELFGKGKMTIEESK